MERKWWTLLAVCVATFMLLVDITIVNVALPAIQRDLHAGLTSLQWVVDAYALTLAATLLTAGSLADRLGRKRVFAVGVTVFSLASLACGLATTPTMLESPAAIRTTVRAMSVPCAMLVPPLAISTRTIGSFAPLRANWRACAIATPSSRSRAVTSSLTGCAAEVRAAT